MNINLILTSHIGEESRYSRYLEMINYYLTFDKISKIIFIDNSDFIPDFSDIKDPRFNYVRIENHTFHKGYGEFDLMSNASDYLDEDCYVIKLTGRLKITRFNDLLNELTFDKIISSRFRPINGWISTWLFGCTYGIYKQLFNSNNLTEMMEVEQGVIERFLFSIVKPTELYNLKFTLPDYGVEGTYGNHPRMKYKWR